MCTNVAGQPSSKTDLLLRQELTDARIEIVESPEVIPHPEVHTRITGKLRGWTFQRNWYYWCAEGKMPIELARELWKDPLGKRAVRVEGHCACPSPDEYGVVCYDAHGVVLVSDPKGEHEKFYKHAVAKGYWHGGECRFVPDAAAVAASAFVESYHVDSEAGLRLLADYILRIPEEKR